MSGFHTTLTNFLEKWGDQILFFTYYFILPVVLPIIIVSLFITDINKSLFITQTTTLFVVVSSFSNIGFLTSKADIYYSFKKFEKEFYTSLSIILGIISLIMFFNSNLSKYSNPYFSSLLTILIVWLYYYNPHIMYSLNYEKPVDLKKRRSTNDELESSMLEGN
jgi:hypothetical protein